mgnify:CR=1 FL=1
MLITHPEQILEIAVKDYIKLSSKKKHILKGYKVPVEFPHRDLEIDPYMIGFWLGDGTASQPEITTQDSTIIKYFKENLQQYKCYLQYINNKSDNNYKYRINGDGSGFIKSNVGSSISAIVSPHLSSCRIHRGVKSWPPLLVAKRLVHSCPPSHRL